ncbi:unnamed protein product [Prunus brigantina]
MPSSELLDLRMTSMCLVNPQCSTMYCEVILFAAFQESYKKDVEKCFDILQARWGIIRGAARMFDEEVLRSIMIMILEDEYDYDAPEAIEPDPMNTALTRIYASNHWSTNR